MIWMTQPRLLSLQQHYLPQAYSIISLEHANLLLYYYYSYIRWYIFGFFSSFASFPSKGMLFYVLVAREKLSYNQLKRHQYRLCYFFLSFFSFLVLFTMQPETPNRLSLDFSWFRNCLGIYIINKETSLHTRE